MLTILSTLISFLMVGLPKLLDFFQYRNDKKHELALAAMQIERELELRKADVEAQDGYAFLAKCYAWVMAQEDMAGSIGV